MLPGLGECTKIYDIPHFLCSDDFHSGLLDCGMVSLACISGLQPVFQNPQSQTTGLKTSANHKETRIVEGVVFTAGEHLSVQLQIERRARELWGAGQSCHRSALNDWLQAEREVLEQFIRAYPRPRSLPRSSRSKSQAGVTRSKPKTRILKRGRTLAATHP
jgi:hypothetical protein